MTWLIVFAHMLGNPAYAQPHEPPHSTLASCLERARELNGRRVNLWEYVCEGRSP